jgi:hypothetical protein
MPLNLSSSAVASLRVGSAEVSKVMLGDVEVWSSAPAGTHDPDAQAYFDRGVVVGGTISDANKDAINTFVVGCKADGTFSTLTNTCLICGWNNLIGGLTPLIGTTRPTPTSFVESDYSRLIGIKGNSNPTAYINTNRAGNADAQNNFAYWVYLSQSITTGFGFETTLIDNSSLGASGRVLIVAGNNRVVVRAKSAQLAVSTSNHIYQGLIGISRSSSTSYTLRENGINTSVTSTSQTHVSTTLKIGRLNSAGDHLPRILAYGLGSSCDMSLIEARLDTLMASLT